MLSNTGGFRNLQAWAYWSGVAFAPFPADFAWVFNTDDGIQRVIGQVNDVFALAVLPGDVTASVPEPQTWTLAPLAIGNHLEALSGDCKGQHSVRINGQWRICFVWTDRGPVNVEIVDYH